MPTETRTKVACALGLIAEVNPQLARKVQPAAGGQMALFHAADPVVKDHVWKYLGQEQKTPHAVLHECVRCGVRRRVVRRFTRAKTTYAARGTSHYAVLLPQCGNASSPEPGAGR